MNKEECPWLHEHTEGPSSYLAWMAWCEKMSKTHRQYKCSSCGFFVVWKRFRMNVGDRVQTSDSWNRKYLEKGLRGTVLKVPAKGVPVHPERNHYVALDEPYGKFEHLWFHPNDLEEERE